MAGIQADSVDADARCHVPMRLASTAPARGRSSRTISVLACSSSASPTAPLSKIQPVSTCSIEP